MALLELAAYSALGGGPKAQDPDNVAPSKAPAGSYDALFNDARPYFNDATRAVEAWSPNAQASHADAATIARNDLAARKFQDANIARLQSIAQGGPGGVAVPAARANLASAGAQNNALAAARATPNNLAGAARLAGNTNASMNAQGASKIAALGAQEQMAAYAALNPALASMRGQDFGVANEQAKLGLQAGLANAGNTQAAALANQDAYNRQMALRRQALGQQIGNDRAMTDSRIAEQRMIRGQEAWDRDIAMERQRRQDMQQAAILDSFSKGMQHYYNAGMSEDPKKASDRNQKTDIESGDAALKALFDNAFGGE